MAGARRHDSAVFSGNSKKDSTPGLPKACGRGRESEPALQGLICKQKSSDFISLHCALGRVMIRFARYGEGCPGVGPGGSKEATALVWGKS